MIGLEVTINLRCLKVLLVIGSDQSLTHKVHQVPLTAVVYAIIGCGGQAYYLEFLSYSR